MTGKKTIWTDEMDAFPALKIAILTKVESLKNLDNLIKGNKHKGLGHGEYFESELDREIAVLGNKAIDFYNKIIEKYGR